MFRAVHPDHVTLEQRLLWSAEFSLRVLRWQQTGDGHKNRNQPKPFPLPGDEPEHAFADVTPMTVADMNDFLGWTERGPKEIANA